MQGQTWVLLRGLVREQRHWEGFPERLGASLPGARIVTLDLPGNGSHWQQHSPWRIRGMVDGARADLAARGITGPYSLLALSLGAMTAFEWMSLYPGEIRRAVLLNTSLSACSPVWDRLRPRNYGLVLRALLTGIGPLERERLILRITTNQVADIEPVALRWAGYATECPVSQRNFLAQLVAAGTYRRPANPPACPVLLLNGGGDRLVHPRCSDRIAAVFGLPLARHPSAGHDLALDAADWVVAQVSQFARQTDPSAPIDRTPPSHA